MTLNQLNQWTIEIIIERIALANLKGRKGAVDYYVEKLTKHYEETHPKWGQEQEFIENELKEEKDNNMMPTPPESPPLKGKEKLIINIDDMEIDEPSNSQKDFLENKHEWENTPQVISYAQIVQQTNIEVSSSQENNIDTTIIEKEYKFSGYDTNKGRQYYWCGCDSFRLKRAYKQWESEQNEKKRGFKFHCCRCDKPRKKAQLSPGINGYHQLCARCERIESYDVTQEPWYNQPCRVCDEICDGAFNIHENIFTGHYVCKYAYLAVQSADNYEHVAQRINHYIDSNKANCTAGFAEVAGIARYYWGKIRPQDTRDNNKRAYHNTLSWNEQYHRHWEYITEEVNDFFDTYTADDNEEHRDYRRAVELSFEQNREAIVEHLTNNPDLTADTTRFGHGKINLCHNCFMPYDMEKLVQEGIELLCIVPDQEGLTCHQRWLDQHKDSLQ
jgi:hypothetical protein